MDENIEEKWEDWWVDNAPITMHYDLSDIAKKAFDFGIKLGRHLTNKSRGQEECQFCSLNAMIQREKYREYERVEQPIITKKEIGD